MPKKDSSKGFAELFYKDSRLQPAGLVLLIVLFVGSAVFIRNELDLDVTNSGASCYGYDTDCMPYVSIAGRNVNAGYDDQGFYYGTLVVPYGSLIELTWYGQNVNRCEAVGRWTRFRGTYMPPTLYNQKIGESQDFGVKCKAGRRTVTANLSVIVEPESPKPPRGGWPVEPSPPVETLPPTETSEQVKE